MSSPQTASHWVSKISTIPCQQGEPRRLTQLASLKVNEAGLDGIYYRSRYGHDLENWALFEPFEISSTETPIAVRPDDVDLQEACRLLGLKIDRT